MDAFHSNETNRFYYFSYTLGVLSVRETEKANLIKALMIRCALSRGLFCL